MSKYKRTLFSLHSFALDVVISSPRHHFLCAVRMKSHFLFFFQTSCAHYSSESAGDFFGGTVVGTFCLPPTLPPSNQANSS